MLPSQRPVTAIPGRYLILAAEDDFKDFHFGFAQLRVASRRSSSTNRPLYGAASRTAFYERFKISRKPRQPPVEQAIDMLRLTTCP